jgi:hypothetical protein
MLFLCRIGKVKIPMIRLLQTKGTWGVTVRDFFVYSVMPSKLDSVNPVELLAICPFKLTCNQMGNHPYKTVSKCKGR